MKKIRTFTLSISTLALSLPFIFSCNNGAGSSSKTSVTIPIATSTIYGYTGNKITLDLSDYDSSKMSISGNYATNVGDYTALIKLKDTAKYQWSNKTTDPISYTWSIVNQTTIDVPTKINKTIKYTGEKITMLPDNYSDISSFCTISGNIGTKEGTYTATIKLNDSVKYKWSDNTTDDKTIEWKISSSTIRLMIPTLDTTTYYYTGKSVTYTPNNYDSAVEKIEGNVQVESGTYTVIVSIFDKTSYTWTDGTTNDKTFTFTLNKGLITKPTLNKTDNGELTYTGSLLTYIPSNYSEYTQYITISGNTGTNVGSYTTSLSLKDKTNTQWADKTSNDFTLNWSIKKKQYALPEGKTYSSTGNPITFYPANFDEKAMTIIDNTGTEEKEYTATISLKDKGNTEWSDGTTDDKTVIWTITSGSKLYNVNIKDTSITLTSKLTSKVLSIGYPLGTTYQINDDTGALTLTYDETTNADKISFSLSGEFDGSVNIIESSSLENPTGLEIALNGVTISDSNSCPLCFMCDGDVDLSAKKDSTNTISDNRNTASDTETYNAAIYCSSDLKLKGKGTLNVASKAYDGIHTKDDLKIQNLNLNVNSADNALKGNDSVTIESGTITAISTYSNGIKTSNNSFKSDGTTVKGTVTIKGGTVNIYSALDGIDSAYDVLVTEAGSTVPTTLNITTCTYSSYSKLTYTKSSNSSIKAYSFGPGGGVQPVGPAGGDEGNTNKYEESTKGIKADNIITISGGTTTIKAYDDAIHSNNTNSIEATKTVGLGNVVISGGTLSIYTMDDGIHADNNLTISSGIVSITNSYEGLEGTQVTISGGTNSIISSDDGINGTGTSGESIVISGGTNYIYAGGDGVDSNSNTSYDGILFSDGKTVIIQTSGNNSSIDTNKGYKYTNGYVLALGLSSGMSQQESTKCSNFSSIGKTGTLSGTTITASGFVTVKMPKSMSVYCIFLGNNSTSFSTNATYTTYDSNNVSWNV